MADNKTNEYREPVLSNEIVAEADTDQVVFCFDNNLNFLLANDAGCKHLNKSAGDLLGANMLELFPSMVSSRNHRNLLRALEGEEINEDIVESNFGPYFKCSYKPIKHNGFVTGVFMKAEKIIG